MPPLRKLDVETDSKGQVVAVWFGCLHLPFKQVHADKQRAKDMEHMYRHLDKDIVEGKFDPIGILEGRLKTAYMEIKIEPEPCPLLIELEQDIEERQI